MNQDDTITLPRAVIEQVRELIRTAVHSPYGSVFRNPYKHQQAVLAALDAALAEPEQKPEPVAWIVTDKDGKARKFLTAPLGFGVSELVRFDGDTMSPLYAGDTVTLDYIKEDKP